MLDENAASIVLGNIQTINKCKLDKKSAIERLNDPKLDYNERREYNNDIIYDNRNIAISTRSISSIFESCTPDELVTLISDIYNLNRDNFNQKIIEK